MYNQYKIIMVDVSDPQFKILSIKYGNNDTTVDIREDILQNCNYHNNTFVIPKTINLNEIKGDPAPGHMKKVLWPTTLIFLHNFYRKQKFLKPK